MKKIKSVRLVKDFITLQFEFPKGKELKYNSLLNVWCLNYAVTFSESSLKECSTNLFQIEYETDYFEVEPLESGWLIVRCEHMGTTGGFPNDVRFTTYEEAEFENMRRETLHYFRELAKELNEGWEWKAREWYSYLYYADEISIDSSALARPVIKFKDYDTAERAIVRAKPEMISNYIKLCEAEY